MKEADNFNEGLGMMATLEQLVKTLGFHDLTSFFIVSILILVSIAFIVSCAIFLVKKRRERLGELHKTVLELQKPKSEPPQVQPSVLKKQPETLVLQPKIVVEPPLASVSPKEKVVNELVLPTAPAAESKPDEGVTLGAALKNTRGGFMEKLARLFSKKSEINDADFEEIEAILFTADIGAKTAQKLLDVLRERVRQENNHDKAFFFSVLKDEIVRILTSVQASPEEEVNGPRVVMFVGVNGAGKTTSIGKLGAQLHDAGKKVVFGAGDTFRAAAKTQLSVWGERACAEVVGGKENADSASVLYEAIEKAKNAHADYVLCDTAGRLHTKTSLMDELKKVHRVVAKAQAGAPHEVYLVIDATMGQNAIAQAREFAQATPLTGIVLSKLDGTAKGGVAIGMVDELKVPIRYIGIGEQVGDFKDFDAKLFVDALFLEV
jgi:fused signal recognition particle receptor